MTRIASALRKLATLPAAALLGAAAVPSSASGAATSTPEPEAPPAFAALHDVDPTIIQEMRYFTRHNFVGARIDGYRKPMCVLTRPAAQALHRVQIRLLEKGYSLKVYDCYRPQRAVDHFVRWAEDLGDQKTKTEFYPRVAKTRLFADGYIAEKSGHSRGSTLDLTVVTVPAPPTRPYVPGERLTPCYAPQKDRFPDTSLDMGTGFDCFDVTAGREAEDTLPSKQRANRRFLRKSMQSAGFVNLPEEWWHFTYQPEPFPHTYFDFPVARRALTRPSDALGTADSGRRP
ncbi:M15 family metallopeptidase [Streptomyces beihaiensis]|uniref:D-alanyl-D-alanine dipeptidase n=1 Tax=Streptomyces beihaiensis TaxID=2984495 RepID=A0ABT3U4K7_9ACTN|nr:M15 family metallopeptidase [Streptomyces beihaiensis]MCX3064265.1 M15 family metallopeptidase [Streptomyces beihaiensis]